MTSHIFIRDLRLHAYHGVLEQERQTGNDYVINLSVDYPIGNACHSDDVADTMSYADAADVVQYEMGIPSQLLEHVAYRICTAILYRFPHAKAVTLDLQKVAPPMKADCKGAGVVLTLAREDIYK